MAELDKVISGLNSCFRKANCDGCVYETACKEVAEQINHEEEWHCPMLDDVLELLERRCIKKTEEYWDCPSCGTSLSTWNNPEIHYCYHCGQAVKWNEND